MSNLNAELASANIGSSANCHSPLNEILNGGPANETLSGGNGDDTIDGNGGADLMIGGNGRDLLIWDPGDGSDKLDGGNGFDTHLFNMGGGAEAFTLTESSGHALLTRDVGTITMDLDNIERVNFGGAGGGADTFFIGDLSASDVRVVDIDLGATPDNAVDTVTAVGGLGRDHIHIEAAGGTARVDGLSADLTVSHAERTDRLVIDAQSGNDRIDARGVAGGITLSLTGGAGSDSFVFGASRGASVNVTDFHTHAGGADADRLVLDRFADHSFDAAVASGHIAQVGADVVISDNEGAIVTLSNTLLTNLGASDFLFA